MDTVTRTLVAAQVAITGYVAGAMDSLRKDDRGQASTEYAGVIFVVVALVAVIIAAASATDIGTTLMNKIKEAIGNLGS
jgi:Flp pilus assembly pilin Flp